MKSSLWATLFLIVLLAICFYEVFFLNETFKVSTLNPQALMSGVYGQQDNKVGYFPVHSTTTSFMEEPIFHFVKESLWKDHTFPLWNPYQGMGYPLIAMMHHGLFWPIHWIYYLLPNVISWDLVILLRLFAAGLFTYWFLKKIKLEPAACLFGGAAFMLSAPMTLYQYGFANVDIVLPLLMIFTEALLERPDRRSLATLGIGVWLTFLAGHPEHIVIVNGLTILYFCFRLAATTAPRKFLKPVLIFTGGYIIGLALSAAVFFPFLREWMISFWHTHPKNMGAICTNTIMARSTVISFFFPHFFQNVPVKLNFDQYSLWGYVGIIPLGMYALALFNPHKKRLSLFFAVIAAILFLKPHVNHPLINWIGLIPIVNTIRFDFHGPHPFAFMTAVTAAFGLDYFLKQKRSWIVILVYAGIVCGIGLFCLHSLTKEYPDAHTGAVFFGLCLTAALLIAAVLRMFFPSKKILISGVLIGLFVLEVFFYLPHDRPKRFDSFPKVPYIEFLKKHAPYERVYGTLWTLYPNTASGYRIDDFAINYGLLMNRYVDFINYAFSDDYFKKDFSRSAFSVNPFSMMPSTRSLFDIAGARYTITLKKHNRLFPLNPLLPATKKIYQKEARIYEHLQAAPRTYIVHRALSAPDPKDVLPLTFHSMTIPPSGIIIEKPLPLDIQAKLAKTPVHDDSLTKILHFDANRVDIQAGMKHAGFLVLLDLYHPDWKAFVSGRKTEIYAANSIARAVFVPKGKHIVSFRYRPIAFYTGIIISVMALILVLWLYFGRKQKSA